MFEAIAFSFLATCFVIFVTFSILSHNNYMQQFFDSLRSTSTLVQNYEAISLQINSNEYVANGTVFIFWSIVGLLVYYLAYFFFISERNLESFFHTLFTKGVDQIDLLEYAFARMAIRVLAVIGILVEAMLVVQYLLPYLIALLNITDFNDIIGSYGVPLIGGVVGIFVYLHLGVIFLRCLMLRVRVIL